MDGRPVCLAGEKRNMRFDEAVFAVVDFETTGLFPYSGDKICEVGVLRIEPDGSTSRFETLIDPERPISPDAFAVNGITAEMLVDQPTIDEILPELMDFLKDSVLVAYNAGFDLGFLECALGAQRHQLSKFRAVDALRLARQLFPSLPRYNLLNVARFLHIYPDVEHRAMADVTTTWQVFELELEALRQQGIETIESISHQILVNKDQGGVKAPQTVVSVIRSAIRTASPICIKYRSIWEERVTQRTITPLKIHDGFESPYVVAFCHLRKAQRTFHLSGILDAVPETKSSLEAQDEL